MKKANHDGDLGFHRLTGTPENQREEGEEKEETENEGEEVTAAREALPALFGFKKTFFLDDGALLPGLLALRRPTARGVVGGDLARSGLQRAREPAGGGLPRVAAHRGVGVRRRAHWAQHRRRVKRRRGLLPIVGVTRRALHVVDLSPGRSGRRRRRQTSHLRVGLRVHNGICVLRIRTLDWVVWLVFLFSDFW